MLKKLGFFSTQFLTEQPYTAADLMGGNQFNNTVNEPEICFEYRGYSFVISHEVHFSFKGKQIALLKKDLWF